MSTFTHSTGASGKPILIALAIIGAGVVLLQLAAPAMASGPNGWIKGYVTEASSGSPVAGAFVRIEPNNLPWVYEETTDATGYFEVFAVPQLYNFIVLGSQYRFYQVQIGVGSLRTTWANASLVAAPPRTALLHGNVTDATTSAPVTAGRVIAVPSIPPFEYINVSYMDAAGYYEMSLVPGGYTVFTDSIPGYFGFGTSVSLADGQDVWLDLSLSANPSDSTITGTVYNVSSMAPLAGATVFVDVDDLFLFPATTDAAGSYAISVPSGFATVTGNMVGYGPDTEYVFVSPMTTYTLDLFLRPILGSIQGYVTDAYAGLPIANATVGGADSLGYYDQNLSDASGYYEIPVPNGSFNIDASAPGYALYSAPSPLNLGQGEIGWWNFSMQAAVTIQGYVVDASNGTHVPGMTVFALDFVTMFFNSTSSNASGFYSMGVIESPALVVSVAAGGGYAGGQMVTSTSAGQSVWANVSVYPLNATVRTHVTDGMTGLPISGASASLSWGFPFPYVTFDTTDANGDADLLSPATSGVNVFVSASGYYSESRTITVAPGLNALDIVLYPVLPLDVLLKGYITENVTGNPLSGAQVQASGYPYSANTTTTGATGYYEMWIVPAPQVVRAMYPQRVANETMVSPNSGDTIWVNMTLDSDPSPPEFASFAATPDAGVSSANPTSLVADILEKRLDLANTVMSLLRMVNASGATGTFQLISQVASADLAITQPLAGRYTVSTTWDARASGGWIRNGTASEWWPVGSLVFPPLYAISGLWQNGTVSAFMGAFFDPTTGDLLIVANESLVISPRDQPNSTFTPAAMGLQIDLGSGNVLGGMPVFGSSYRLEGLRFAYDERVPTGRHAAFLQAADTGGNWNYSIAFFDVDAVAPVSIAGPDQTVEEDGVVTFNGSGSSDDVGIVNYTWTFTDGGSQTLYDVSPTYTFATPGTYIVTLTVRDASGATDTDSMTVTVLDITLPTAAAGVDRTVDEDTLVTFDGSGSIDNVGVTNFTWTFTDGTAKTIYGSAPSYTFATPGTYLVTLTVRDAAANTASDSLTVTVRDVTVPTANAGPDQTVDEDTAVTFDGSGSTDNVGVSNFTWSVTDGTAKTLYGSSATYVFATPGVYTVTLTVRDAVGSSATDTLAVTVRDVTAPTVSIASPPSGATVSGSIVIAVTASDNVGVARIELRVDGALVSTDTSAPYELPLDTRNYSDGSHTIRVTVHDAAGNAVSAERPVTFSNPAPSQGFGLVEYGSILLVVLLAVALLAWLTVRRGKGRPPAEAPSEPREDHPHGESSEEPSEPLEEL